MPPGSVLSCFASYSIQFHSSLIQVTRWSKKCQFHTFTLSQIHASKTKVSKLNKFVNQPMQAKSNKSNSNSIYMYIYMYIYVYICTHTHIYIYILIETKLIRRLFAYIAWHGNHKHQIQCHKTMRRSHLTYP
jgi:hypothetical protein